MSAGDVPLELRVHGVGGPQGRKMLGMLQEEDLLTVTPFTSGINDFANESQQVPVDSQSRFTRRVEDDRTEAYEWGALTTGSLVKALWIVYFPFTVINAAGWAHSAVTDDPHQLWWTRLFRAGVHAVAGLATALYVLWIGYLVLDLVAEHWRHHVLDEHEASGLMLDAVGSWLPVVAPLVFLGIVALLVGVVVKLGQFEQVGESAPADEDRWDPVPQIADPFFFARPKSYERRRNIHVIICGVVTLGVLVLYVVGWHRIGLLLILVAMLQTFVLVGLCVVDGYSRFRNPPHDVSDDPDATMRPRAGPRWVPIGAVLATVGTVLVHLAFCGAAMLLRPVLANIPDADPQEAVTTGPELGSGDVLGGIIVFMVIGVACVALYLSRNPSADSEGIMVTLARRTQLLGFVFLVAVTVPVVLYAVFNADGWWNRPDRWWGSLVNWYDGYSFDSSAPLQRLGGAVLVALPVVVYVVLRGPYDSGLARTIGNAWDVLTFWPRRFHPFAAPPSAERAVPELRERIKYTLPNEPDDEDQDRPGLVVVAHSQGSVLAAAAIASCEGLGPIHLVTFGSPLGTLYAPTWPAYVLPLLHDVGARVESTPGWANFWRATDAVGAEVPGATNTKIPDPRIPSPAELDDAPAHFPLERPRRPDVTSRHSHYLSTPDVQEAISERRPTAPPPQVVIE